MPQKAAKQKKDNETKLKINPRLIRCRELGNPSFKGAANPSPLGRKIKP